jgi:hypothetical protein
MRRLPTARTGYRPRADPSQSGQERALSGSQVLAHVAYELLPITLQHLDRDDGRVAVRQPQLEAGDAAGFSRSEVRHVGPSRRAYARTPDEPDPITRLVQPHHPDGSDRPHSQRGEGGDVAQDEYEQQPLGGVHDYEDRRREDDQHGQREDA